MKARTLFRIIVVTLMVMVMLPAAAPARAVSTAIGQFYGGCGNFSVDVAVFGTQDDGGGFDRFRYNVTDGNNKTLYQENFQIKVGSVQGSQVVNLKYSAFAGKNPIRFAVVDLDGGGNGTGEVGFVNYDAPCMGGSGQPVTRSGYFTPGVGVHGPIIASTNLYETPAGNALNLKVLQGEDRYAVYRNSNASWVAIFIGGNDLVWIPASSISLDFGALTVPPIRVFGSGYSAGQNEATGATGSFASVRSGPAPFSGQAVVRALVNMRAAPTSTSAKVSFVPRNATVTVLGRNKARSWVKISFNGVEGWITSYYVKISSTDLRNLPVVQ